MRILKRNKLNMIEIYKSLLTSILLSKLIVPNSAEHILHHNGTSKPDLWDDDDVEQIIKSKASLGIVRSQLDLLINKTLRNDERLFEIKKEIAEIRREMKNINRYPSSCAEALGKGTEKGIYTIRLGRYDQNPFSVYCNDLIHGGGWTVIQRRQDGSVDFLRKWNDYKTGFGNLDGEFFIGLDKLYAITTVAPQELLIVLQTFENVQKYAKYEEFAIGNENQSYVLSVLGKYSGDAEDGLSYHLLGKFTTVDKDNDLDSTMNCASKYKGAWWYKDCHASNLNGLYLSGYYSDDKYGQGIVWFPWKGHYYSFKIVEMLVRPKRKVYFFKT